MRLSIFALVLISGIYIGCSIRANPYYENDDDYDEDDDEDYEEDYDDQEEGRNRRILPQLTDILGVPDSCVVGRKRYRCELTLVCWMSGKEPVEGCDSVLYRCCVPKRAKASPAGPKPAQSSNALTQASSISVANSATRIPPNVKNPKCGIVRGPFLERFGAQRRIVGGDDAGYGHFPWQALIRIGSSRCGGSLVNRLFVVTAGHCVARAKAPQVIVTLGEYELKSRAEPFPSESYRVIDIVVHPRFEFTPQADRFDVAVLRLDRPVQYKPHITPICLPRRGEGFEGMVGYVAGWGATEPGSKLRPSALQAVDVPIISNALCEIWHKDKGIGVRIFPEMICAGYRGGGKDSCQGDSGGPLMVNRFGVWYLVGLVSAGFSCAQQNQPGIYHRIAYTVDWIEHHIII